MIQFKKITFFILLFFFAFNLNAQHNHGGDESEGGESVDIMEYPPHHGIIKLTGKYYIEMVVDWMGMKDKIKIYLIKKTSQKVMNRSEKITGKISFINHDGDILKSADLMAYGDDAYKTPLGKSKEFSCRITFTIKGKEISATFMHVKPKF